ncbi:NADH-quinone oxidoreductase subunit L [Neorickettsia sp. 179522]|uniref:NADH-quinone oxidoreductase subunit L n=1 Tax=Neorickettsia sp. 179522 TaxID=1714371 RepID=UPI000794C53C|nr:NADH-quinone oxidoreductase subunit L [Neorickettsia sp. 179522]KYH12223.1 NADH dehydrogenase [Neorickettsia sp. 179522]
MSNILRMLGYSIVFLPLLSCLLCCFFVKCRESIFLQLSSSFLIGLAAVFSWSLFFTLKDGEAFLLPLFEWISVMSLQTLFRVNIDKLTVLMFVVVNTVSFVVHCYSIGYMKKDPCKSRFFAYLSLFTFAMLALVSAGDLLQLFLGWEGVGVCSYLLIGFWFRKESANAASMKAFLVNRVGDFCFLIGIFSVYKIFGTLELKKIISEVGLHSGETILGFDSITFICSMLFIGCMSKSAQLGLHTWLPDAMEGPTPVSALIHAATMVTAGVFLLARLSPLFECAELVRHIIMWVGVSTAAFGAVVALCQDDIKRIIAYSTCSQLGYMFAACGASAYGLAIFHLSTHAFFKALLFLCAGNVIHSIGGEQDIHKMGALKNKVFSTYCMMFIGSLALCGIFPFAGFYSKDLIISSLSHAEVPFILLVLTAFCTSVYSCRLLMLVFFGEQKFSLKKFHAPSVSMILPLVPLVLLSLVSGYFGVKLLVNSSFWMQTGLIFQQVVEVHGLMHFLPLLFALAGFFFVFVLGGGRVSFSRIFVCLSLLSFLLNFYLGVITCIFLIGFVLVNRNSVVPNFFKRILSCGFYFDEVYRMLFVGPLTRCSRFFWKVIDVECIDLVPTLLARISQKLSSGVLTLQAGFLYHTVLFFLLGMLFLFFVA